MVLYKKILVLIISSILGPFWGYTNVESLLTRLLQINENNPNMVHEDRNRDDPHDKAT